MCSIWGMMILFHNHITNEISKTFYTRIYVKISHMKMCRRWGVMINKTLDHEIRKLTGQTYIADDDTIKVITFDGIQVKERLRYVHFFPQDPDVAF